MIALLELFLTAFMHFKYRSSGLTQTKPTFADYLVALYTKSKQNFKLHFLRDLSLFSTQRICSREHTKK